MIGDGEEIVCDGSLRQQVQAPLPELTIQDDDYIEVQTGTIWKSITGRKICSILQEEPGQNPYLKDAGLVAAFEQEWPQLALPAVKDFVRGFVTKSSKVQFRGRTLNWNVSTLRAAFCLPNGDFAAWKAKWTGPAFDQMFTVARNASNPYSMEKMRPGFSNLQRPIRLIHELLLGKSRPTGLNGKQMWIYWSYWWHHVSQESRQGMECPQLKPDWARLVHDDLTGEIVALRKHLNKENPPKKRYASNCGTAIMKYLLYHGYSMEELLQEENNKEEDEIEPATLQDHNESEEDEDENATSRVITGTIQSHDNSSTGLPSLLRPMLKSIRSLDTQYHTINDLVTDVTTKKQEIELLKLMNNEKDNKFFGLEQELKYVWHKYDEAVQGQDEEIHKNTSLSAQVIILERKLKASEAQITFLERKLRTLENGVQVETEDGMEDYGINGAGESAGVVRVVQPDPKKAGAVETAIVDDDEVEDAESLLNVAAGAGADKPTFQYVFSRKRKVLSHSTDFIWP